MTTPKVPTAYLVTTGEYSSYRVLGVFTTYRKAKDALDALDASRSAQVASMALWLRDHGMVTPKDPQATRRADRIVQGARIERYLLDPTEVTYD